MLHFWFTLTTMRTFLRNRVQNILQLRESKGPALTVPRHSSMILIQVYVRGIHA